MRKILNLSGRNILTTLLVLFCLLQNINAQVKTRVTGVLADSLTSKPIAWATVGIYRSTDTNKPLQNIFSTKNGRFEFPGMDTGRYSIFITYTGYPEKEVKIVVGPAGGTMELPLISIAPSSKELGAVVVTASARKPLLEQEEDRMIYNAEADPSVTGLTATDVLRKTPLLTVDAEGNVTMNGQSSFKILLNGKETPMFARNLKEALQGFPASLIKRVEVSSNPSAKYDGEGSGGIINIITQKKVVGYNGNINVGINTLNSQSTGASFNVKYGKIGFNAFLGMYRSHGPGSISTSFTESLNPVAFYQRRSAGGSRSESSGGYGDFELSMDIDSLNSASVYGGFYSGRSSDLDQTFYTELPSVGASAVQSTFSSTSDDRDPNFSLGANYSRKSRKIDGQEFNLRTYTSSEKSVSDGNSDQQTEDGYRGLYNRSSSPHRETTLQADLVKIFRKDLRVETGVKAILRNSSSDYRSFIRYDKTGAFVEDADNSNRFSYHQEIYSVFATASFKIKQYSFRLGSRVENTNVFGDFIKTATTVSQHYTSFLPNVFISRKFKKIHTVSLAFGKRLRRPYIDDLNPFVSNLDSFDVSVGNPELGPDITYTGEIGYTVIKGKNTINARLLPQLSNRQTVYYSEFDDATGVRTQRMVNAGVMRSVGLNVNYSTKPTKKWTVSSYPSIRYRSIRNRLNAAQKNSGFSGGLGVNSSYQFSTRWAASAGGNFYSPDVNLQGRSRSRYYYNASTSYKLFKDKVVLSMSAANFFMQYLESGDDTRDENFIRESRYRSPIRSVRFSLQWNFGKLSEDVSRKKEVSNDDGK